MKTKISRDKLIIWFINNEFELYTQMCNSCHTVDLKYPNVFHAENEIFTHTLMVMTVIEANKEKYTDEDYIVLVTSALLHDTGKPQCQQEMPATDTKPIRNSFQGHEGVSSFIAVGVLKKLQRDFPEIYTDKIIEKIIKVVSLHGAYIEETSDLYFLRCEMHKADKNGAVRSVDEAIFSQYSPRKYIKQSKVNQEKRLILLIGLPNSGKSTLRSELNKFGEYFVLSRDDLLETFYEVKTGEKASYNEMYNYIHKDDKILKEFENCFRAQIEQSQKYSNVLVDMTQLSLSSRRKMLNNFQNFRKSAIVVMTDNAELYKRNKERFQKTNKYISEKVIFNMMTSFVFPVLEEGFEDIELVVN